MLPGGLHALDNDPTWGQNSENAFAYHLSVNAPADGETETNFLAMDLDGGWTRINYADHFPELALKKMGNTYYYEFSMAVYDDSYDHSSPENSRSILEENKYMGLSMAYCDNDAPDGERDNFFGSVWVPEEASNDHWINADGFGSVRLVKEGTVLNTPVEAVGSIEDYQIIEKEVDHVIHQDIRQLFSDPDGDNLTYTVEWDEALLSFTIVDNQLIVNASPGYNSTTDVEVVASDGDTDARVAFKVFRVATSVEGLTDTYPAFTCYPNPFSDRITIEWSGQDIRGDHLILEVYNSAGQRIMLQSIAGFDAGISRYTIDLAKESPGQYIVKLKSEKRSYSRSIYKR